MSNKVYVISDLHMGHKGIQDWAVGSRGGTDIDSHNEWLVDSINSVVTKKDTLWILGDIAWTNHYLPLLNEMKGYKKMILGNHDKMCVTEYMKYGRVYPSLVMYKKFWLSHAPIHQDELRMHRNIHGHTHNKHMLEDDFETIDTRYINVCVEALKGVPVLIDRLHDKMPYE